MGQGERGGLSDAEWERLRPFLPVSNGRCGRWRDHRQVINGILYRVRTGVHWRDLPEWSGPWKTVYERHRLWSADGTWERLLQQVQAASTRQGRSTGISRWTPPSSERISMRLVPAPTRRRPSPPQRGARGWNIRTKFRGRACRPAGGGGAGGEGLGRSRGGFTGKAHLSADSRCRPFSLIVTPGQRADCTQFIPVLGKIRVPRLGPGRPRKKPDSVAADKAYSNSPCREYLRRCGVRHTIPEKTDSRAARLAKDHEADCPRLRRRAVQEAQHRRAGHQQAEEFPCRRDPV
ncbi:IS5 family transposase [Streptomyces sp. NRRL F-5065]|uniref:IS5 family transposase n=1 Tax=Streptomyces sp. NRRL F-5065 TaxID=1463855 RepID=UPI000AB0E4C8